jgi:Mg-chelatase subunit ChlD
MRVSGARAEDRATFPEAMMRRLVSSLIVAGSVLLAGCRGDRREATAVEQASPPTPEATAAATSAAQAEPADVGGRQKVAEAQGVAGVQPAQPPVAPGPAVKRPAPPSVTAGPVAGRVRSPSIDDAPVAPRAAPAAPQIGPVRAGEWDDNANYREFRRYLGSVRDARLHRTDVGDRQFLVVRDADGRAVPRCPVTVRDDEGHSVTISTTASGRALLFPRAEGLDGAGATASASCEDGRAMARFSFERADNVVDLKLDARRSLPHEKTVDLAFILDTTGSMGEEIAAVKATIQKVASALARKEVTLRIGLVEYKDRGDPFVTKVYAMTTDVARFRGDVARLSAGGGGDYPESVNEGLHVGLTRLEWSGDAVVKLAFLIGDAPPHLDYAEDADYAEEMVKASHRGIQIFTVAASGMDALGQAVWRQIAQYTGGTNLFVLRGGAGPQSVGGGDPASSCGGTQTSYASGNLDELIVQKVEQQLRAIDGDPLRIPGVGVDENAKPCNERIVFAQ